MGREEAKRVLVLGVGNILLKDEGIGVRAIEFFKERFDLPPEVTCVDGGTMGLRLLSLIRDFKQIVIIDAVSYKSPRPGAIHRIEGGDLKKSPPLTTTAHQLGILDLLSIASFEGHDPEVVVIGMEPTDVSPGLEVSELLRERLPRIARMLKEELERLGFEVRERAPGGAKNS